MRAHFFSSARALAVAIAVATVAGHATAQNPTVRVDTVLLVRDIDGDGRSDYVVREWRPGSVPELRSHRVAVYLNAAPGTRASHWATQWDEAFGREATLFHSVRAATGVWLLGVLGPQGDATEEWFLLVQRGNVREEVYHRVDYGEGHGDVRGERDQLFVEATLPQWTAMRFVFDPKERRIDAGRALCVPRR